MLGEAWGRWLKSWLVEHIVLDGDPALDDATPWETWRVPLKTSDPLWINTKSLLRFC